jgi:predicted DNA-binding ArsR family transcriptional regulator
MARSTYQDFVHSSLLAALKSFPQEKWLAPAEIPSLPFGPDRRRRALAELEEQGAVESSFRTGKAGRPARVYRLRRP